MILVEGSFRVADLEAARPAMEAMIAATRAEAGCIEYAYSLDLIEPGLVRVVERWESREALAAHLKAPHIARWRAAWPALGISDRSLRVYDAEAEPF